MNIISTLQESTIHRETYIAILNGLLKESGAKAKLALKANITPGYLSYLLAYERDPYNLSKVSITRTPSPKVAKKIVNSLEITNEEKEYLLHHMVLSNEKKISSNREVRNNILDKSLLADTISNIGFIFNEAAKQPAIAKNLYNSALDNASTTLRHLSPKSFPVEFVTLCHLIYLIQVTRGRLGDSLWHAKLGRLTLENLFIEDYKERRNLEDLLILMTISEGHTYHLLHQDQTSIMLYEKLQNSRLFKQNPKYWSALIVDKKMSSISSLPRFSISEVDNLADNGLTIYGDDVNRNVYKIFSISLYRIRAHMRHNNIKKAEKLLGAALHTIEDITPKIGIGNSIRLFLTAAQFYSLQNAINEWGYFIDMAYGIASQGRYELQKRKIEAEIYRMKEKGQVV